MVNKIWDYSGTTDNVCSDREIKNASLARRIASEGIVLLKNEGVLPLCKDEQIVLLGSGAGNTIKGGTGSGDVNNRENISIHKALKEADANLVNEKWVLDYEKLYIKSRENWRDVVIEASKNSENPFEAYALNPYTLPQGRVVESEDIRGAKVALYVVSRISGEGKDRQKSKGDYFLSDTERSNIMFLDREGLDIVLIINAGGPVEITGILEETTRIKGVLNIAQLGQEGGRAVCDVLFGNTVPGGRLATTWARHYDDYPFAEEFGSLNGNVEWENYYEDIYVGYRYFDSFGVKTLFPFGYGLSYTDFAIEFKGIISSNDGIDVDCQIVNSGKSFSGREVVQIYVSLPQNGKTRELRRLVGFAKTKLLEPGERENITIHIEQKQLASFEEEKHEWCMDSGRYIVWIGKDVESLEAVAGIEVSEDKVNGNVIENVIAKFDAPLEFERLGHSEFAAKIYNEARTYLEENSIQIIQYKPEYEKKTEQCTHLSDVASKISIQELIPLLHGKLSGNIANVGAAGISVPGSAGETYGGLSDKYGISSVVMADGPAGVRLKQSYQVDRESGDIYGVGFLGAMENGFLEREEKHKGADVYYQYCTAFPVGTTLAQTWDTNLMEEFGNAISTEMREFHIGLWLAPGMSIQRNPLCGRNYEYLSEDPCVSGMMAAAITVGVQKNGKCGVTIKHFACNNQEDNRMGVDARVSEKSLREIYLRGFEIAVKKSNPLSIMTSYNQINGVHSANNKELCTNLTRKEWGFDGMIMTDWCTTFEYGGSSAWKCIEAGNDLIMPGIADDAKDILDSYKKGILSEDSIRACADRVINLAEKLN